MTRLQRIHTWAEHAARLAYMPPRLPRPQPLPTLDQVALREWTAGWLQGLLVGLVNGAGLAVLLGWLR